jgi:hypothetical protein
MHKYDSTNDYCEHQHSPGFVLGALHLVLVLGLGTLGLGLRWCMLGNFMLMLMRTTMMTMSRRTRIKK